MSNPKIPEIGEDVHPSMKYFAKYVHDRVYNRNKNLICIVVGETGCLSHKTIVKGQKKSIGELYKSGKTHIQTVSIKKYKSSKGTSVYPIKTTSEIIDSGKKEVFEIELEDGRKIIATAEHKLFKCHNNKITKSKLKDLKIGDKIRAFPSNYSEIFLNKANTRHKAQTRQKFNPKKLCKKCQNLFFINLHVGKSNKKFCKSCKIKPLNKHENQWFNWEDNVLRKFYEKKEKDYIQNLLPLRNWKGICKRARRLGIKRDKKFQLSPMIKTNFTDNVAKRPEVRALRRRQMKDLIHKNPKASLNYIMAKKKKKDLMTSIEKTMYDLLVNKLKLKQGKDFFYNQYMKVKGTYKFPDFTIPKKKLVIECDGAYWHKDVNKEIKRDKLIQERGYKILHFTGSQIRNNIEEVQRCIAAKLNQ